MKDQIDFVYELSAEIVSMMAAAAEVQNIRCIVWRRGVILTGFPVVKLEAFLRITYQEHGEGEGCYSGIVPGGLVFSL